LIDITTIATGSSGNCYRIADGETVIMIEAGIRFQAIREAFGFRLSDIAGCLVSHEHGDHAKAVKDITKAGIDCYMSKGTREHIKTDHPHRIKIIQHGKQIGLGTFIVMPFNTQHDAEEPLGFLIASEKNKILFATDTYYLANRFSGLTHIIIEANYRKETLDRNIDAGLVHPSVRARVMRSHFEIENVKNFLTANDLSQVEEIHLIHISSGNGDPGGFKREIEELTGKPVTAKQI